MFQELVNWKWNTKQKITWSRGGWVRRWGGWRWPHTRKAKKKFSKLFLMFYLYQTLSLFHWPPRWIKNEVFSKGPSLSCPVCPWHKIHVQAFVFYYMEYIANIIGIWTCHSNKLGSPVILGLHHRSQAGMSERKPVPITIIFGTKVTRFGKLYRLTITTYLANLPRFSQTRARPSPSWSWIDLTTKNGFCIHLSDMKT